MSSEEPFATVPDPASPTADDAFSTPSVRQAAEDLRDAATMRAQDLKGQAVDKAQALKTEAETKAQAIKDAAVVKANAIKERATDTVSQAREIAEERWQETRVKARQMHANSEDYVRANPTKAVLTAAGIGFIVGLLYRR